MYTLSATLYLPTSARGNSLPSFGARSRARLASCDERIIRLFEDVVTVEDCSIECGARPVEEEIAAIASGHSKLTDPWDSKHVVGARRKLSEAVDAAPYPVVWPDTDPDFITPRQLYIITRFYHFAGFVKARALALGIPIRWGGAWSGQLNKPGDFMDLVHFELA